MKQLTTLSTVRHLWSSNYLCKKFNGLFLGPLYLFCLELFFPRRCVNCGKFGDFLCFNCASNIEMVKTDTCFACGKISENSKICAKCRSRNGFSIDYLVVASKYDAGPVKEMIHHLKYSGLTGISEIIGMLLVKRIDNRTLMSLLAKKEVLITAVPLHKNRYNQRGFNQSDLIAKKFAEFTGHKYQDLLTRKIETRSQVGLSRKDRLLNMEDAFIVVSGVDVLNKTVVLVDDVVTTGATLNACAKVLKAAGAKKVIGMVAARNQR